jgi:hypothetical protein
LFNWFNIVLSNINLEIMFTKSEKTLNKIGVIDVR